MRGREGPPVERTPALVLVGETLGWLEPCGCTEGMLGGLPRRAAYLKALQARGIEPIVLDLGDLVREPGRQSELKLDAIAEAYKLMNVRAIAVGERDLPYLERIRELGLPILMPGERIEIATRAGPIAVRAIPGADARAHFEAAGVTLPALASIPPADVTLFHGSREEANRLFPGPHHGNEGVIYSGHGEEYPRLPDSGGPFVLVAGDKGKYAILVKIRARLGSIDSFTVSESPVPLGDRIADDPEVAAIVERYKRRLFEEDLVTAEERKLPESGGTFIGPEACAGCHKPAYKVFQKTKHVHAFESLVPRNGVRDPECLRCHSTGSGFASGFAGPEATPDLAQVSCESCHGVGSNHIRNPQPGFGRIKEPARLCVECHDKENSPNFDFDRYWPRIAH